MNLHDVDQAAEVGTSGRAASPPFSRHPTEGKCILSRVAYQARMGLVALREGDDRNDSEVVRRVQGNRREE